MSEAPENDFVTFQKRAFEWAVFCFGPVIPRDKLERSDRLLEEVFELLQSGSYPPERVAMLRDYVWSRPVGEPSQELGGTYVTLAAYSEAHDLDMRDAAETELARVWDKAEVIRAKQLTKPKGSPLPVPTKASTAEMREIAYVKALREVATLGSGKCTVGRPLALMVRDALAHADRRPPAVGDQPIEGVAEALWQAESERAGGRRRLVDWLDESNETRERFRHSAFAAVKAYEDIA